MTFLVWKIKKTSNDTRSVWECILRCLWNSGADAFICRWCNYKQKRWNRIHRNKWLLDQIVFVRGLSSTSVLQGPGSGMNKFNMKKLRSQNRAAQAAANAKQTESCARQIPLEACVWVWLRSEIWWILAKFHKRLCKLLVLQTFFSANRSFQIRHTQKRRWIAMLHFLT